MSKNHTQLPAPGCLTCPFRAARTFCDLAPFALADYDSIGNISRIPSGSLLFREDEPGEYVYVLCTGHAKLSCMSRDGKTMNLKIASPGDVVGLSAVVSGTPYEFTAQTIEPTVAKIVGRVAFNAFLDREGEASRHAALALAEEFKSALAQARRLALSGSVPGRLAGLLLDWGRVAACGKADMRFTMPLTHDDLAAFTATTRESVTRTFTRFQKDKLISVHGNSIQILQPDALATLTA